MMSDGGQQHVCVVCGAPASSKCARCKTRWFCTRDHQLKDWKSGHKEACKALVLAQKKLDEFFKPKLVLHAAGDGGTPTASVRLVPGKGKGLFAERSFERGEEIYREPVLVAGIDDSNDSTSSSLSSCRLCFKTIGDPAAAVICPLCGAKDKKDEKDEKDSKGGITNSAIYCSKACQAADWRRHRHLCQAYQFKGEDEEASKRRRHTLREVRAIGSDALATTEIIADVIARGVAAKSTALEAWHAAYGQLDAGGMTWTALAEPEGGEAGRGRRRALLEAFWSTLQDCFALQLRAPGLDLEAFLREERLDGLMASVALNVTSGSVTVTSKEGGGASKIWALAQIHACTNHTCCPAAVEEAVAVAGIGTGAGAGEAGAAAGAATAAILPNVFPEFVPADATAASGRGGGFLMHRCVALRPIAAGDELTISYATQATATAAGYATVRAFLKGRRFFDCQCAACLLPSSSTT